MEVSLYIETTIQGPRVRNGAYAWVLECIYKGEPVTREGVGGKEYTTINRLALMALTEAISKLQKPCSVRVITQCEYVSEAWKNGWLKEWQRKGWNNAKGKPIEHQDLWQELLYKTEQHTLQFVLDKNPHKECMLKEAKSWEAIQGWKQ